MKWRTLKTFKISSSMPYHLNAFLQRSLSTSASESAYQAFPRMRHITLRASGEWAAEGHFIGYLLTNRICSTTHFYALYASLTEQCSTIKISSPSLPILYSHSGFPGFKTQYQARLNSMIDLSNLDEEGSLTNFLRGFKADTWPSTVYFHSREFAKLTCCGNWPEIRCLIA